MSFSNTATPIYYGQFRDAVLRGDIPVCQTIEMEMNRIDVGIALAHLYLTHPDRFRFFSVPQPPRKKGFAYMGSLRL